MSEFSADIRASADDLIRHTINRDNYLNESVTASDPGWEEIYVDDMLSSWVYMGDGDTLTGGKHENLLPVALAVADIVMKYKVDLSCYTSEPPIRRTLVGLRNPEDDTSMLDKLPFDRAVHWRLEQRTLLQSVHDRDQHGSDN